MKRLTLLMMIFLGISVNVTAQENGKWILHGGVVIPGGDFADDDLDNEKALAASVGVGLNLEYIYPLNDNGLGLFAGLGINYNWLKSDAKDEIIEEAEGYADEDDIRFMKYFTIPVSAGLNYTYNTNSNVSLFGNLGLVANLMKITNQEIESYEGGTTTQTFDFSSNLGFKLGGGVILNEKTYISLNYISAGKQKIKGEIEYENDGYGGDYDNSTSFKSKHKINYLTLTVGFRL